MKRKIIGEGSYGCVHSPSIHCKTNPKHGFDYKMYVSKIMKTKNAKKELNEFLIIGKIDPNNEYHLGQPILCKPDLDESTVKDDIKQCKHINLDDVETNPDNYSLLLLKFGGVDLKVLCGSYLEKYLEKNKTERSDKFWLEVHHLLKGLKFFKANGIIHNDIKPQNILFDTVNGKMKYIDFGLMRTKKNVISSSMKNNNYLGIYHWSYPFDCAFMNIEEFDKYKESKYKDHVKNTLSKLIISDSENNPLDLPIKRPSSFKILFTYLNPENILPNSSVQYGYIDSFFDGFNKMISNNDYNDVLNHIADSIDVFGLGFTLQHMANCFKRLNSISLEDFTRLSTFFHKMYDFNPLTRVIDIDLLINEYENILLELGVLMRLKKSFENNNVINKSPAPFVIMEVSKNDEKSEPKQKQLSIELQEFANKDPILISLRCPEEKEFNPITKRCVKKCKEGYKRDEKFKCYSITKKNKHIQPKTKSKSVKICPENKELNFRTNRCVKKCPDGYLRNYSFKCYKRKHTLNKSSYHSKTKSRTRSKGRN
jgi:serine/threonine protein kinase